MPHHLALVLITQPLHQALDAPFRAQLPKHIRDFVPEQRTLVPEPVRQSLHALLGRGGDVSKGEHGAVASKEGEGGVEVGSAEGRDERGGCRSRGKGGTFGWVRHGGLEVVAGSGVDGVVWAVTYIRAYTREVRKGSLFLDRERERRRRGVRKGKAYTAPSAICFFFSSIPASELSHSIFPIATSHVSLTSTCSSFRYLFRTGRDSREEIAPRASAAYHPHRRSVSYHSLGRKEEGERERRSYFMSNHGVLRLVLEDGSQVRESGSIIELSKDVSELMLEKRRRVLEPCTCPQREEKSKPWRLRTWAKAKNLETRAEIGPSACFDDATRQVSCRKRRECTYPWR
jgi:hypothetical protein